MKLLTTLALGASLLGNLHHFGRTGVNAQERAILRQFDLVTQSNGSQVLVLKDSSLHIKKNCIVSSSPTPAIGGSATGNLVVGSSADLNSIGSVWLNSSQVGGLSASGVVMANSHLEVPGNTLTGGMTGIGARIKTPASGHPFLTKVVIHDPTVNEMVIGE